jgi:hypothetical protein
MHIDKDRTDREKRTPLTCGGHGLTEIDVFVDHLDWFNVGLDLRLRERGRRAMAKSVVHVYRECVSSL